MGQKPSEYGKSATVDKVTFVTISARLIGEVESNEENYRMAAENVK
jgi:hypothetical protein